ncbi:MAG: epoxyqueuosine reductase [Deltaproteobacteria bacterium]|nr:epoxyqueuosine reductase [Deltaproteobacteria bacterium]
MTTNKELSLNAKECAKAHGANLVGVVRVTDLPEHESTISRILPSARSVMVVAATHSRTAISSDNNQAAQFDTIYTYNECSGAAHAAARYLESQGFPSAAVPAFLPIDMGETKKGMRGDICWRRTAVRAGLGSYGENGLLVTREYGAAVRLSGVVTAAELEPGTPLEKDVCDHCMRCVEACPAGALSGEGKIDKKLCGDVIFKYGFRYFHQFIKGLIGKQAEQLEEIVQGQGLMEIWQNFMTGNYYYCFQCQSQCPATKQPSVRSTHG